MTNWRAAVCSLALALTASSASATWLNFVSFDLACARFTDANNPDCEVGASGGGGFTGATLTGGYGVGTTYYGRLWFSDTNYGGYLIYPLNADGTRNTSAGNVIYSISLSLFTPSSTYWPPSGKSVGFIGWSGTTAEVRINSAKKLEFYIGGSLTATGTTVMSDTTHYRVCFKTNASNSWVVTLNESTEMSGSDNIAATSYILAGNPSDTLSGTDLARLGVDNILISDTFEDLPVLRAKYAGVTGDGTYTAWTGDYTGVDDGQGQPPHDSLTSYVYTSTNTDAESSNMQDTSTIGVDSYDDIKLIKTMTIHSDSVAQATTVVSRMYKGGSNWDTTGYNHGAAGEFALLSQIFPVDPDDSLAWTSADVDAVQVGIVHAQSQSRQANATAFHMVVAWVDGSPSAMSGSVNSWW